MTPTPVLMVNPSPQLDSDCGEALTRAGYRVIETGDIKSAAEVARRTGPGIVLVDASTTREAPVAMVARLREDSRTGHIPVLVLRAGRPLSGEDALCQLGGVRCLARPFRRRWLLHEVQYLTTRSTTSVVMQESRQKETVLVEMGTGAAEAGAGAAPARRAALPVELRRSLPVPLDAFQGIG